jgi:hypothetical protein
MHTFIIYPRQHLMLQLAYSYWVIMQLPTSQVMEPDHRAQHDNACVLVIIQLVRLLHATFA